MVEGPPWLFYFLAFVTCEFAWSRYLDWRQYRHLLRRELPKELEGIVTPDEFTKSTNYQLDKLRFSIVETTFSYFLQLLMYAYFYFPGLWHLSSRISEGTFDSTNEYVQALIFCGLQIPPTRLLSIPFELYFDFVLEEQHGFNKKTLRIFFVDMAKSLSLMCILGAPILCLVIWVINWGGKTFYFWLWGVSMALTFFMLTIYPHFIAPLFNKYEPLKDEELKAKIENLAKSIDYPLKKIYQVDESIRSTHSNAYLYGFWRNKRIVLYDTLLHMKHEQILAIMGHELGHWKLSHSIKNLVFAFGNLFVTFYLFGFVLFRDDVYQSFGFDNVGYPIVVGLLLFTNIYEPVSFLVGIISTLMCRVFEFQADAFSARLGMAKDCRDGLIELQKKNLGAMSVDPLYAWFHYSHPHLVERLKGLELEEQKLAKKD